MNDSSLSTSRDLELIRKPMTWIIPLSVVISLFLVWLIYLKPAAESTSALIGWLPALNASLNALAAICISIAIAAIRRGNRPLHIRMMIAAVVFSALFLASYITYHHFHGDTRFLGTGFVRPIYFFILISHIVFSIVALPMVLGSIVFGASGQYSRHRSLGRRTWPVWLYVSATGVAVFVLLRLFG